MRGLRDQVAELLDEAREIDFAPTKLAILKEATRIADVGGDEELAFEVRQQLLWPTD